MTHSLKTTVKGAVIAVSSLNFIGCTGEKNSAGTVSLKGSAITSATLANAASNDTITVDGQNRLLTFTTAGGTTGTYYLPFGTAIRSGAVMNYYTINKGSTLFTGTIEDKNEDKVQIGLLNAPANTDPGLFDKDFKFANDIALLPGTYDMIIPGVKINDALKVTNFVIKNIMIDLSGNSNFIKSIAGTSVLPVVGAPLADGKVTLKLDTLGHNKNVKLTLADKNENNPPSVSGKTDGNGEVTLDFAKVGSTLGNVDTLTLDLNS